MDEVVRRIAMPPRPDLIENKRQMLQLLVENTSVSINHDTAEKSPTIRYVDFRNPDNNFVAVCQFKVRIPGIDHHIVSDIVLFLNGLPVTFIECKPPRVKEPIDAAID